MKNLKRLPPSPHAAGPASSNTSVLLTIQNISQYITSQKLVVQVSISGFITPKNFNVIFVVPRFFNGEIGS